MDWTVLSSITSGPTGLGDRCAETKAVRRLRWTVAVPFLSVVVVVVLCMSAIALGASQRLPSRSLVPSSLARAHESLGARTHSQVLPPAAAPKGGGIDPNDASCSVGVGPYVPAYEPVNHDVYVPNSGSNTVTVIKNTCTVEATITFPAGTTPIAAAFDPQNNHVYLTAYGSDEVYAISGTKIVSSGTITSSTFHSPWAIVWDPADSVMAVTNFGDCSVTAFNPLIAGDIFSVPTGCQPLAIDYDPYWETLDVANEYTNNVTVIDAYTFGILANPAVGRDPNGVAFDPANGDDYVANLGTNNVSVISDVSVVTTISGFDGPISATWSQASLAIVVPNYDSGQVDVIQGTSIVQTINSAVDIARLTYDDFNDDIYITDLETGTLYVYSTVYSTGSTAAPAEPLHPDGGPTVTNCPVGEDPQAAGYDPVTHEMYVPNFDSDSISVFEGQCSDFSTIDDLELDGEPGGAAFDPQNNYMYVTDGYNNLVYEVSGDLAINVYSYSSFDGPYGIVWDPADAVFFVSNANTDTVTYFNPTSGFNGAITVGDLPRGMDYDPYWVTMVVANDLSDTVSVIDAYDPGVPTTVEVSASPTGVAFDPVDDDDYVADGGSYSVSEISDTSLVHTTTNSGLDEPYGAAWAQSDLGVYVPTYGTGEMEVSPISLLKHFNVVSSLEGETGDTWVAYDDANDGLYVTNVQTDSVFIWT